MKQGDIVVCLDGGGYLKTGDLYTVRYVAVSSDILLYEVDPPEGYTSFKQNRFKLVDPPELPESLLEELLLSKI